MITMGAMALTLALTSTLLIIGIVGTVIGITRLVYPSGGRRHRPIRRDIRGR
jgi:hypothetical protein